MTAGQTGPVLLQDVDLLDKLQYFDREQIPPRNVHAMGTGAYGCFTVSKDISKHSCAKLFSEVGKKTDIFVRFSGIFTGPCEAETVRDPRGFAIKFYTEEGNWDLLAINTPVFPVRDIKSGPDVIHAFKRDPRHHEWNSDTIWDFVVNHPESLHQTLMLFTDRDGTPASYRNMNAYGCNTFSLLNKEGKRCWVKFHITSDLAPFALDVHQAKLIAGENPDFLSADLRKAIQAKNFPKWKLSIQVMPEEQGYKHNYTFDCTKIWPHDEFPLIEVGTIELNRLPTDFMSEVEQVAFSPSNVVPGIGFSPDRLLQGRLFLYPDTQYHRLGPNFRHIPINAPHGQFVTPYIGGPHNMEYGKTKFPGYFPSCFGGPQSALEKKAVIKEPKLCAESGDYYQYKDEGSDCDYFEQPKSFLGVLAERDFKHLATNISLSLAKVDNEKLLNSVFDLLRKADDKLEKMVRKEHEMLSSGKSSCMTEGQKLVMELGENLGKNRFQDLQDTQD